MISKRGWQMRAKTGRYWRISGYRGEVKIFETKVRYSDFSENQMKCLLKAMASKQGLDFDQMIGAYAAKQAGIFNDLLCVRVDNNTRTLTCGSDPYFTATLVVDSE